MANAVALRLPGEGATVLLGPSEYLTDIATGEETSGHYTIYEVVSAPGGGVPLHEHDWAEAFYVLEGEYEISYLVENREVQVVIAVPGAFVNVPGRVLHAYRSTSGRFSKMLSLNQPVGLEPLIRELGLPCSGPGAEPERGPIPPEEFRAGFQRMGVRVQQERLAESAVGAWKDE